ncbi:MAG: DUF4129 domain-containing protein [Candidatus Limnocylindrales bacterium]
MTTASRRSLPAFSLPVFVGPALIAVAEGAWIAVLYEVLEVASGGDRTLGLAWFIVAATFGVAVGSRTRAGHDRDRTVGAGLVVIAVLGWLAAPAAIAGLVTGDPGRAVASHPGGFLLGVAAFRGILRGRSLADIGTSDAGLGGPAICLAAGWLFAGALAEPGRSVVVHAIVGPTILFLIAGPGGTAMNRVAMLGRATGFGWTANRAWIAVLWAGLLFVGGVATIAAADAGVAIRDVAPTLLVMVAVVVVARAPSPVARRDSRRRTVLGWLLILGALSLVLFLPQFTTQPRPTDATAPTTQSQADTTGRSGGAILVLVGLGIALAVAAVVLRRRWIVAPTARSGTTDKRLVAVDWHRLRGGWRVALRRSERPDLPADAVGAYLAALATLGADPTTRRGRGETPADHARRLRADGAGGRALDLLAADYALIRFGGRGLSAVEHRRALGRWRRIEAETEERARRSLTARATTIAADGGDGAAGQTEARDAAMAAREGRV